MSFMNRFFRCSGPIAPTQIREWWSLSGVEQTRYDEFFLGKLHSYFDSYAIRQQPMLIIDHEFCQHSKGICIDCIPMSLIIDNVKKVTEKPFCLSPTKECIVVSFIQNLERVTAILPPSQHLARSAVRDSLIRGDGKCPVTCDLLSEIELFCVGICGHVFSHAVVRESNCPVCREPMAWTTVKKEDL
jgi:hypothetical protein